MRESCLVKKLKSQSGVSIIIVLLLFAVCASIAVSVIAGAVANASRSSEEAKEKQERLLLQSATELFTESIDNISYSITYTTSIQLEDPAKSCHGVHAYRDGDSAGKKSSIHLYKNGAETAEGIANSDLVIQKGLLAMLDTAVDDLVDASGQPRSDVEGWREIQGNPLLMYVDGKEEKVRINPALKQDGLHLVISLSESEGSSVEILYKLDSAYVPYDASTGIKGSWGESETIHAKNDEETWMVDGDVRTQECDASYERYKLTLSFTRKTIQENWSGD